MKRNYADYMRQGWRIYRIKLEERYLTPISQRFESDVMYDAENQLLFIK